MQRRIGHDRARAGLRRVDHRIRRRGDLDRVQHRRLVRQLEVFATRLVERDRECSRASAARIRCDEP